MSYEYANMLFNTPRQASRAAVSDFLYAGGNNSTEFVASMKFDEAIAELRESGWEVPYLDEHNQTVDEMVREIIAEALEQVMSEDEE